ncbi:MAG: polysaccharide deacetylase family protein [Bacteroidales bacterium]|nr:polysaccharide deacetylase family protein [Bacteroidales bacterium]
MKRIILILSFFSNICFGQIGEICNWDSNKKAAVVLTFDDWLTTHPTLVIPALKERSMTATFYFIAKNMSKTKATQLQKAFEAGHEIGNHSYTHPQSDSAIASEVRKAKMIIDSVLPKQKITTFDYPYGTVSDMLYDTVKNCGHIAARGVWPPTNFKYSFASKENDYYNIRTVSVGGDGVTNAKNFASYITKIVNGGGLLTFLYHGVDKSSDYANVPKEVFYAELDTLQSFQDKIWITTLANAILYHKEKRCAQLSFLENESIENSLFVEITDTLPDSIYNYPLTVRIFNNGKTFNHIEQQGTDCPILFQNYEYVLFRAIPDGGVIELKYGDWDVVNIEETENDTSISIKNHTIFVQTNENATVILYSTNGQCIDKKSGSCQFQIEKPGFYIIMIDGKSKKIVIE